MTGKERIQAYLALLNKQVNKGKQKGVSRYIKNYVASITSRSKKSDLNKALNLIGATAIVKSIPQFKGTFELDVRSNVTRMLIEGDYESSLKQIVASVLEESDHFVDIGANIGLYTTLASHLVGSSGKVLSIEPEPFVSGLLQNNIRRNKLDNVSIFSGAVMDKTGEIHFNSVEGCPEYSSLGSIVHPHAPRSISQITVKGDTLDNLLNMYEVNPKLIKIDVEGAELLVLKGATKTLSQLRPVIICEADDRLLEQLNSKSEDIARVFMDFDYKIYDVHDGKELAVSGMSHFIGEIVAIPE